MEAQAAPKPARILVVDDDIMVRKAWRHMLHKDEFVVELCPGPKEALQALNSVEVDVVLTDVLMDGMSGLELLEHIKRTRNEIEVIVMTGHAKISDAVSATRAGAFDYITKPFKDIDACINRVRQAARLKRLSDENLRLREAVVDGARPETLQTKSPVMRPILRQIERLARVDATVLVTGPTGSGKTAIANTLHELSRRQDNSFVHVDCGQLPADLIEAELFGHMKGAFTGAVSNKKGRFEEAHEGTIFLDEIGNLPLSLQPKLLRVLNDGVIRRVGGESEISVDVRVISATNVDLGAEVEAGRFREDLYYRLNVVGIALPPLNDRREDIPQLGYSIMRRAAARNGSPVRAISAEAMERLVSYDWKGNIRELENIIERAVIFESSEELGVRSLPPELQSGPAPMSDLPGSLPDLVDLDRPWRDAVEWAEVAVRAHYLRGVLEKFEGNVTKAAKHADLDRSNFRRHLKRYLPNYGER